jgi:hypothetical protein
MANIDLEGPKVYNIGFPLTGVQLWPQISAGR